MSNNTSPTDDKMHVMFKDPFQNQLKTTSTNGSNKTYESTFDDDDAYEQDWSSNVPEHETWAAKERRRSTPFGNLGNEAFIASHHEAKHGRRGSTSGPRHGSILSIWTTDDGDEEHDQTLERVSSRKSTGSTDRGHERRGSILSLFTGRKDENGRPIIGSDGPAVKEITT